jgi:hypothetical protein
VLLCMSETLYEKISFYHKQNVQGCLTRACRFCSSRQKSIQWTECSGAVLPWVEFLVALRCQSNGFHLSCCYCSTFLPHRENHSPFSLPYLPLVPPPISSGIPTAEITSTLRHANLVSQGHPHDSLALPWPKSCLSPPEG